MLYISLDGGYFFARSFVRWFVRLSVQHQTNEGVVALLSYLPFVLLVLLAQQMKRTRAACIGFISQKNTRSLVYPFIVHELPAPLQLWNPQIHSKHTRTHTILWSHLWNLEICSKDCTLTLTHKRKKQREKEFHNENSFSSFATRRLSCSIVFAVMLLFTHFHLCQWQLIFHLLANLCSASLVFTPVTSAATAAAILFTGFSFVIRITFFLSLEVSFYIF